jgi:hypothetical protein
MHQGEGIGKSPHACLCLSRNGEECVKFLLPATPHREKGKTMAEPQETRQEQEARWDAQRVARDQEVQTGQRARQKKNRRTWLTVAVIVLIVAVIAAVVLL